MAANRDEGGEVIAQSSSEPFTDDERRRLAPYFTNIDRPVFALVGLPEVVKGALFARYSRSAKSLRRLFLDEFAEQIEPSPGSGVAGAGLARAEQLFERVFVEYGDDSVAQLGGVHLACEGVSNLLTKLLEWGRLMAYLEQSTRYVAYTDRPGGRWRYRLPDEIAGSALEAPWARTLDDAFATYTALLPRLEEHFSARHPREATDSPAMHRRVIRAKALDAVRGLLPAAALSNVGIYGTGQAWENLLLRLRAHPLSEARTVADAILTELRRIIPAFLTRVDQPERGLRATEYLADTRREVARVAAELLSGIEPAPEPEVRLVDFDPEGEVKVVAAALYAVSNLGDRQLLEAARRMSVEERGRVLATYVGQRANRRHKPGRAFERTSYRFDLLGDYGAFRDLQRHRLLTLEWQRLSPAHGWVAAEAIDEAGAMDEWRRVMDESAAIHERVLAAGLPEVAPYVLSMAYRVRYYMEMNAREAMHVIELRTAPQGHASYRRVCQEMHRLIAEQAGHRAIAAAMRFADHGAVELERLRAERALERKRGE